MKRSRLDYNYRSVDAVYHCLGKHCPKIVKNAMWFVVSLLNNINNEGARRMMCVAEGGEEDRTAFWPHPYRSRWVIQYMEVRDAGPVMGVLVKMS